VTAFLGLRQLRITFFRDRCRSPNEWWPLWHLPDDAFKRAIEISADTDRGASALRAALSLAKLFHSMDRPADAHALLASALKGFSPTPEFPKIANASHRAGVMSQSNEPKVFFWNIPAIVPKH
jgi:hypothetical protein